MTFASFEEFWPYYVAQHQNPICRTLHFIGTGTALACVAASPVMPSLLLAAPIAGYGMAWIGHFVFEGNKPATFGHVLWSLRGDLRMFRKIATKQMGPELGRAAAL